MKFCLKKPTRNLTKNGLNYIAPNRFTVKRFIFSLKFYTFISIIFSDGMIGKLKLSATLSCRLIYLFYLFAITSQRCKLFFFNIFTALKISLNENERSKGSFYGTFNKRV